MFISFIIRIPRVRIPRSKLQNAKNILKNADMAVCLKAGIIQSIILPAGQDFYELEFSCEEANLIEKEKKVQFCRHQEMFVCQNNTGSLQRDFRSDYDGRRK